MKFKEDSLIKKIIALTIAGLIVLSLIIFNVPIPAHRTVTAIEISHDDPEHIVERTVKIRGWWHINLFGYGERGFGDFRPHYEFRGRVEISGDFETAERYSLNWVPIAWTHLGGSQQRREQRSPLWRWITPGEEFVSNSRVLLRPVAVGFWHVCTDGSEDWRYIVLNATTRDEAVERLRKYEIVFW